MDRSFVLDRITATKGLIVAYEGALLALAAGGGVESYTFDSGQNRQTVTRANIPAMQNMLTALYNQLATLEARVYGGTTLVRPAW